MTCKICSAEESNYKCPKCEIPYCSIPCFRKHRPDGIYICKKQEPIATDFSNLDCQELRIMLKDQHLQKYITAIVNSDNPNDIFDQLRYNTRYIEFQSLVVNKLS